MKAQNGEGLHTDFGAIVIHTGARRRDEVCGARDLIFGLKVGLEDPPGLHTLRRMIIAEIERMDTAERLRTMEALWDALCREPIEPESPEWHESLLEARRSKIESGEAKFISLDEVRRRLQE